MYILDTNKLNDSSDALFFKNVECLLLLLLLFWSIKLNLLLLSANITSHISPIWTSC